MTISIFNIFAAILSFTALISSTPMNNALPIGLQGPDPSGFRDATVHVSQGGQAVCVSGTVPVTASATNYMFNFNAPQSQAEITQTFINLFTPGSPFPAGLVNSTREVSGTYDIFATFCTPPNITHPKSVQFLTHGVGFDQSYWDFTPGYSYVDYIVNLGEASFSYDRLGAGRSSNPALDPLNEIQAPLEVAIAAELLRQLRAGTFSNYAPERIVGVGHSLGSIITQGVTALPNATSLLDTAVLTGFSLTSSGQGPFAQGLNWQIASQNDPYRFSNLSNGYIVAASAISNEIGFLHYPGFDPELLDLVEASKATATLGEFFSLSSVISRAANFTNGVSVVNGLEDLPFCNGNCSAPFDLAAAALSELYPNAKNVSGGNNYLIPDVGHGITLHYNAPLGYQFIQKFVSASGN